VAQAGPKWSAAHLEAAPAVIAQQMLRLLCDRLGTDPTSVRYAVAHRWRYANVAEPLGRPFLRDETGTLYLGGDWCLEARVEAAWTSGVAIAQDMLEGM
jgi:predicted NAD/FAD-dependent oxidoreductase